MNNTYTRKYFEQTLKKELKKPDREAFLMKEIHRIEKSAEYLQLETIKSEKRSVDEKLYKIKQIYPTQRLLSFAPKNIRDTYEILRAKTMNYQRVILEAKPLLEKHKTLKVELREISEDTRHKFFIEVVKGYLSREQYLEIWAKANTMYEEAVLEICEKSMDELRKETHAN
ncbi:MAG: hypothetical protein VYB44_07385 [Bacteroidota bacterium]|nr:hypothetical protein [Bacteroidota bacterium]